jgi:hypothetical protein
MKLSIREYCKKADTKGHTTQSIETGKFKTDHVMERRKLINGVGHER